MPETDRNRLQEEAIRRAREMQSRARFPGRPREPQASPASEAPPPASQPAEPQAGGQADRPQIGGPQTSGPQTGGPQTGGLLDALFQDKERTVILALLILLSGEDGNHELMFALLFLLM